MWLPNRSDTVNWPVQSLKQARSWKFWIYLEEGLNHQGAEHLGSYCEADLRLCFNICGLMVFSRGGSFVCYMDTFSLWYRYSNLSRHMGNPTKCLGENEGAYQLRGYREVDQRLCFRYTGSTNPLLHKS